jgi:hypothetical protein
MNARSSHAHRDRPIHGTLQVPESGLDVLRVGHMVMPVSSESLAFARAGRSWPSAHAFRVQKNRSSSPRTERNYPRTERRPKGPKWLGRNECSSSFFLNGPVRPTPGRFPSRAEQAAYCGRDTSTMHIHPAQGTADCTGCRRCAHAPLHAPRRVLPRPAPFKFRSRRDPALA